MPEAWHDQRLLETRTYETPWQPRRFTERGAWEAYARSLRRRVLAASGIWTDPGAERRDPPRAEVYERTDHPDLGYSVEKVQLETLPGYVATGNLYRPSGRRAAGLPARRAAILNPHGH